MKRLILSVLCLLGTLALFSSCNVNQVSTPEVRCELDLPEVPISRQCEPDLIYLPLIGEQRGRLPEIDEGDCGFNPETRRIVRVAPTKDGDFIFHLYVGVPATVRFQAFGANCEDDMTPISKCYTSSAVAVAQEFRNEKGFDDIYVVIDYELFEGSNYEGYRIGEEDYLAVAAIDDLPKTDFLEYSTSGTTRKLPIRCDGTTGQIIVSSCDEEADLESWVKDLGLKVVERHKGKGRSIYVLGTDGGLSPNVIGGNQNTSGSSTSSGKNPIAGTRKPKQDTSKLFIDADFLIKHPVPGDGLYDASNYAGTGAIVEELGNCLKITPSKGSSNNPNDNLIVAIIDGGVEDGVWSEYWDNHRYQLKPSSRFQQSGELGYDFIRGDNAPDDESGHGTTVASILLANYEGPYNLTALHYKTFGRKNLSTLLGSVLATHTAIDIGANLINMSWGLATKTAPDVLTCAIDRAMANKIVVVTTAGNDKANLDRKPQWPGSYGGRTGYDYLITTGSYFYPDGKITKSPEKVDYSNFSDQRVTVSAYLTSQSFRYGATDPKAPDSFTFLAGTSVSAPILGRSLLNYASPQQVNLSSWLSKEVRSSSILLRNGEVYKGQYLSLFCPTYRN